VIEERCDLFFTHFLRMAFAMEKNVTPDPVEIGLLGADAVVFDPQVPADAVEQFGTWCGEGEDWHRADSHHAKTRNQGKCKSRKRVCYRLTRRRCLHRLPDGNGIVFAAD
jgi:hypothetical protein